jgi:hypothetical protein
MSIGVNCGGIETTARTLDYYRLDLHKPMSAWTAFFILQTPVFLRKYDHSGRTVYQHPFEQDAEHSFVRISSTVSRSKEHVWLSMSPAMTISCISLYPGASLHSYGPHDLRRLNSQLTTSYTSVYVSGGRGPRDEQATNAVIALLRMQGLQIRARLSARLSGNPDVPRPERRPNDAFRPHPVWHISVKLSRLGAEAFLEAVSQGQL